MATNRRLTSLDLSENDFSHRHARCIADFLIKNHCLKELRLHHNKLDEEGGSHIATALEENTCLTDLDLSWNHIRLRGAQAICNALLVNTSLRRLDVSWNGFAKEGCQTLATALVDNESLVELDLSANRIGPKALPFLLQGLVENTSLSILRIGNNPLTTECALLAMNAIRYSTKTVLNYLDLGETPVDGPFLDTMYTIQEGRQFDVNHGPLYRRDDVRQGSANASKGLERFDPDMILFEYMKQDNFRTVDLFHYFDSDDSGYINKQKWREGFVMANIPMTESALEDLIQTLDTSDNKRITLQDLMAGYRRQSRAVAERQGTARRKGKTEDTALRDLRDIIAKFLRERTEKMKIKDEMSSKERLMQSSADRRKSRASIVPNRRMSRALNAMASLQGRN